MILSAAMLITIPEGLTIFTMPENVRRRLRASNIRETLNSKAEPESQASFQTKPPAYASPRPSLWTFPKNGSLEKHIFERLVTTNPNQENNP
jgi:hypothetical protein